MAAPGVSAAGRDVDLSVLLLVCGCWLAVGGSAAAALVALVNLLTVLLRAACAVRVTKVDPTGSAGDLELWELHEELLREVSVPPQLLLQPGGLNRGSTGCWLPTEHVSSALDMWQAIPSSSAPVLLPCRLRSASSTSRGC